MATELSQYWHLLNNIYLFCWFEARIVIVLVQGDTEDYGWWLHGHLQVMKINWAVFFGLYTCIDLYKYIVSTFFKLEKSEALSFINLSLHIYWHNYIKSFFFNVGLYLHSWDKSFLSILNEFVKVSWIWGT